MIRKLSILALAFSLSIHSQGQRSFSQGFHDSLNLDFEADLREYIKETNGSNPNRSSSLDSFANLRTDYFIRVLKSSAGQTCLKHLVGFIPDGSKAHRPKFGLPDVFREPVNLDYPQHLPYISSLRARVKAEIMEEAVYCLQTKKQISDRDLTRRAIADLKKHYSENFILQGFKDSPSHDNAIRMYAKNKFGISTRYLISREWLSSERMWKYEVLIYSLAVFSE